MSGDRDALTELLFTTYGRLEQYIKPKMPSDAVGAFSTEDIVQETHVHVFKAVKDFKPEGEDAFFRWLCAIANNR